MVTALTTICVCVFMCMCVCMKENINKIREILATLKIKEPNGISKDERQNV